MRIDYNWLCNVNRLRHETSARCVGNMLHKLLEINVSCGARRRDRVFSYPVFITTSQSLREPISASSRCRRILHLHSRWVMHFKSLKRAAIFTRYFWDLLGRGSIRRHDWSETLRVYIEYSSHEYVYASFVPYRFSKIRHLRFEKILIVFFFLIGQ